MHPGGIMLKVRALALAAAAMVSTACASTGSGPPSGEVFSRADAAKSVVLHVDNLSPSPMELRTLSNGRSMFIGSVSGQDSTNILLDATLFPTGSLYLLGIPSDRRGQARVGPLSAGRGDIIKFTIQPALDLSRALVVR
jgi:outer membrane lipoprotein-sorting protein